MSPPLDARLPRHLTAAATARGLIAENFGTDLSESELDTAKLLITELVNNAVVHGSGEIRLQAELDADRFRATVMDEGDDLVPLAGTTEFDELSGWGLHIVNVVASKWGMFEGTTHVWFELERDRSGP